MTVRDKKKVRLAVQLLAVFCGILVVYLFSGSAKRDPSPQNSELRQLRQDLASGLGERVFADAEHSWTKRLARRELETQLRGVRHFIDLGQYQEAHQRLADLIARFPGEPDILIEWALLHLLADEKPVVAAESFVHLLVQQSEPEPFTNRIAKLYEGFEQYEAGLVWLATWEEQAELPELAWLWRSRFEYELGHFARSRESLTRVGPVAHLQGHIQAMFARLYVETGVIDKSVRAFLQAEQIFEREVTERLRQGKAIDELVADLENLQLFMARKLVEADAIQKAELILLKLSQKMPSHPEVSQLLDQIRYYKLAIGAG